MFDEHSPTQPPQQQQPAKQEPQDIFSEVPTMRPTQVSQPAGQIGDMQLGFAQESHSGFNPKLILIIVAILAVLVIAAFGIQFALRSQQGTQQPVVSQQPPQQQAIPTETPTEPQAPPPGLVPENQPTPAPTPIDQLTNPQPATENANTVPGEPSVASQKSVVDTDGDELLNDEELQLSTDPSKSDTDGDALSDFEEVKTYKTNPLVADTDSDGLDDRKELKEYKSDPLNPDTDGDGYLDGAEVNNGYSPVGAGKLTEPTQ